MGLMVGVDVGGTFTDVAIADTESGAITVAKVASTPANQSVGFMRGLDKASITPAAADIVMHGTTVATNAVLEGKGARVGMLVTSGFRDVLEIGRGERTKLYDLKLLKLPPLVPRSARFEVNERTRPDGTVVQTVERGSVEQAFSRQTGAPFDAWVVCFLHSYANPANEERAARFLRELIGDTPVTVSSDVVAEYREYERFSTAVLNAFVAPQMDRYLRDIEARLAERGYAGSFFVMQSSGGIMTAAAARRLPAATMLSGPAGGVAGALAIAEQAGIPDLVTCDMGGTSTDVCLVRDGRVRHTTEARISGYPTRLPQLDIVSVGAGGGSIASVGVGRVLRVGPESAGAKPGPACYGLGGTEATVTDANLLLNRLDPTTPLSGEIPLQPERARLAIETLASALGGLDTLAMAEGIVRLAVVRMAGAIRQVSVYRGHNLRDFALLAFGGAGPLVASELAAELGMKEVVVPPYPGNLSALGLLVSPLKRDFVRTRIVRLAELSAPQLEAAFAELEARARSDFEKDSVRVHALSFHRTLDLRYVGQSFTLNVALSAAPSLDRHEIEGSFHAAYHATFGHAAPGEPVELVNLRLAAALPGARLFIRTPGPAPGSTAAAFSRRVFFRGRHIDCPVYERAQLAPHAAFSGPAVIQEPGSSTLVWPGDRLRVDPQGNLRVEVAGR